MWDYFNFLSDCDSKYFCCKCHNGYFFAAWTFFVQKKITPRNIVLKSTTGFKK